MKKKAIAASALTAMALFGASQQAKASAVMIPAIKSGGGWVTVLSYITTTPSLPNVLGAPGVHITYQFKSSLAPAMTACSERNLLVPSSTNDLTTFIVDATVSPVPKPPIFEGGLIGTVGGGYDPGIPMQGFAVLENVASTQPITVEDCDDTTEGTNANCQTLAAEAIVFNLTSRFLYSQRAIEMHHRGFGDVRELWEAGGGNHNTIAATVGTTEPVDHRYANIDSAPNVGYFAFLPTDVADTFVYAIAVNRNSFNPGSNNNQPGSTVNFSSVNYAAAIRLTAITEGRNNDFIPGNPIQGYYLRDEQRLSAVRTIDFRCAAEIRAASEEGTPGLVPLDPVIRRHGAWFNLRPVAYCQDPAGTPAACNTLPRENRAAELGDGIIALKVEVNPAYGFAITPLHQLIYIR
ncbi:hypothetical protein [Hydrogenobacter sp. Uz 6-8]|uniref:hypothetical protein n=1 Tax=Hydrogenobacter sp. Uz 6-8 TaxID=3384828 RepID=UPI0038FC1EF0